MTEEAENWPRLVPEPMVTDKLVAPFGRGINFQIDVDDLGPSLDGLAKVCWPLFMMPEEKWYRKGDIQTGQRQYLVQDPDGYLLRLAQAVGDRKVTQ